MTSMLAKRGACAIAAGLMALAAPGAVLAGGPTNRDQGNAPLEGGVGVSAFATSSAGAVAVQAISNLAALLSTSASPALEALTEALESAGPGTPEAAQAVSQALAVIVTPAVAANPPVMSASQTARAVALLNTITAGLSARGVPTPPAVATLTSVLQSRLS